MSYPINKFRLNYYKIRFLFTLNGKKRAEFLKRKNMLRHIGDNVHFQPRKLPSDTYMIKIHNNVRIASGVTFINHDRINMILNNLKRDSARYHLGCIEIKDNVFIGSNSTIMYNVKIGKNVIVAAGSVVTKDIPDGSIVGGAPAEIIGDLNKLVNDRLNEKKNTASKDRQEYIEWLWSKFDNER